MNTPLPANEAHRPAASRQQQPLAPAPEVCDDLTRLVAYICGTPSTLISLVDAERRWLPSQEASDPFETPCDAAFYAHGILQSDVFVVPDVLEDERFADQRMASADRQFRFYASVPLAAPDGQTLGMVWVKDHVPRQLGAEQVEALRALGRQAGAQLALRQYMAELERIIAEHQQAEERLGQELEQEAMIRAQAAALAELSTPLIPISDQVMVMPLVGTVDSRRAQQVVETLLQGIAESKAQVAILDITGVPIVDTQVANALVRAAQAVRLLGAQVVLTGIRPEVAQTLVGLGVDLSNIITHSSLQSGIAFAMQQR